MPVFEYKGQNSNGEPVSGTLFCASMSAAADDLTKRGFVVEHLVLSADTGDPIPQGNQAAMAGAPTAVAAAPSMGPAVEGPKVHEGPPPGYSASMAPRSKLQTDVMGPLIRVPLSDLMFFFRQLGTMLHAGVGMVQCLDTLATQTSDPRLRAAVREFRTHTLEGRRLTFGMERYPDIFTPVMISLVRAGEEVGRVDESLKLVAKHIEQEIMIRNLYRRVTFYPKLVLVASIVIVLLANGLLAMLGKGPALSSPLTQAVTWLILGPLIVLTFLFFRVGVRHPAVRETYDKFTQALPYLGTTLHQFAMAKFGRTFGTLYSGGVPIGRSVRLAADACGNEHLRRLMYPCSKEIEEGGEIAGAFAKTGAFSPIVLDMVRTGETTGNIDDMMGTLARFYEDEAESRMTQAGHVFGVVVLLIVGVYVGYVVITTWMNYAGGIGAAVEGAGE